MKISRHTLFNFLSILLLASFLCACGGGGSGGGSSETSSDPDGSNSNPITIKQGQFLDSAVQGLAYVSGGQTGTTDVQGMFNYEEGAKVRFSVGDIIIGEGAAKAVMTPVDLVAGATNELNPTVTNIARFLLTLDDDGKPENGIVITELMRNNAQGKSINFQQDMNSFENDGNVQIVISQLTALSQSGAKTLIPVQQAQNHLRNTLTGGGNDQPTPTPTPNPPSASRVEYVGKAKTVIGIFDRFANFIGTKEFIRDVRIIKSPPKSAGGITENNPYNLIIIPEPPTSNEAGDITIYSADPFTDPADGVEILFQYWTLQTTGNGISGKLIDEHINESAVRNSLNGLVDLFGNSPIVYQLPLRNESIAQDASQRFNYPFKGTSLNGEIDDNQVNLHIEGLALGGGVSSGISPFVSDIEATKIK